MPRPFQKRAIFSFGLNFVLFGMAPAFFLSILCSFLRGEEGVPEICGDHRNTPDTVVVGTVCR